tara:strand:+ start:995 stop:1417 length:423 start_codon:yes stop_codon:yes gene_type:complete
MSLVTIYSFETSVEANLVRTKIESEGIPCFLINENFANLMPLYNVATGGVKLQVNDYDAAEAVDILKSFRNAPLLNEQDEEMKCPKCGSVNIYNGFRSAKNVTGFLAAMFSFLLAIYPFYSKVVYLCRDCGKEFSEIEQH